MVEKETAERERRGFQRRPVGGRPAAVAGEELRQLQAVDHRGHVAGGDRQEPQRRVLDQLDQQPAGADQQQRAVERIAARADDRLDALDHLLHQEAVDTHARLRGARRRRHGVGRGLHLLAALEVERHAAGLGLMQDVGRADLERDREADRRRRLRCLGGVATALLLGSAMP